MYLNKTIGLLRFGGGTLMTDLLADIY